MSDQASEPSEVEHHSSSRSSSELSQTSPAPSDSPSPQLPSKIGHEFSEGPLSPDANSMKQEGSAKPKEKLPANRKEVDLPGPSQVEEGNKPPPGVSMVLTKRQFVLTLFGLSLGMFMAFLDSTIVSTALPAISSDLGSFNLISWVITAYLLSSTAVTPIYGRASDILGRKRMFMTAITIFSLSSLICGLATSMGMLIAGRALQGLGGGGLMSLVMIVIGDIIPPRERGKYQGLISGTFAVASVLGPVLGGVFTDTIGWRWAFFINLPVGFIGITVVFFGLKNTPIQRKEVHIDVLGIVIMCVSVVTLMLALTWGGSTYAWGNGVTVTLFVVSGIFAILFIYVELRFASQPVVPFRVLAIRNVWVSVSGGTIVGVMMFTITTYLPLYFQIVRGISAENSGLSLLPCMAGVVFGSMFSGTFIGKTGHFRMLPIIGAILFTLADGLFSLLNGSSSLGLEIPILFISGAGVGMCFPVVLIAAQNAIEMKDIASVTTSLAFFRTIGGVIGVTLFQTLLSNEMEKRVSIPGVQSNNISPQVISHLPSTLQSQVINAYQESLSMVWLYFLAPAALGLLFFLFMKHQVLRSGKKPAEKKPPTETQKTSTTVGTKPEVAGESELEKVVEGLEEGFEMAGAAEAFG